MQLNKNRFEFPDADLRHLFRKVKTKKDLEDLLHQLKNLLQYFQKKVSYYIEEKAHTNGKILIKTLAVYFTCCNPEFGRPAIYFVSYDKRSFVLQNRSLFTHCHQPKLSKNEQKSVIKDNSQSKVTQNDKKMQKSVQLDDKRFDQPQNQKKLQNHKSLFQQKQINNRMQEVMIQEQKVLQSSICQRNQQQQIVRSLMIDQVLNENEILPQVQQFNFPQENQLQFLQEFDGLETMKKAFESIIMLPHHESKKIKLFFHDMKSYSAVIGSRINIQFQCCNEQYQPAFLTYTSEDNKKYKLSKSYNLKHIHNKKCGNYEKSYESSSQKLIEQKVDQELKIHNLKEQIQQSDKKNTLQVPNEPLIMQEQHFQINKNQVEMQIQQFSSDSSIEFLMSNLNKINKKSSSKQIKQNNSNKFMQIQENESQKSSNKKQQNKKYQNIHINKIELNEQNKLKDIAVNQDNLLSNQKQIFTFPSLQQLKTIKGKSEATIRSIVQILINLYPSKNFQVHSQTYESSTEIYDQVYNLKFYFDCCRGVQNKVPYLHFSRLKKGQYQLINSQIWHDHSKRQNNYKKYVSKERFCQMIQQLRTQEEKKNHSQASKISSQNPNQVFYFPSNQFLYKMNKKTNSSIKQALFFQANKVRRLKKKLDYYVNIKTIEGSTNHYLQFIFNCCKGFKNKQPFLRFSIENDSQYYIVAQNRWHDHRKKPVQKKKHVQKSYQKKKIEIVKDIQIKKIDKNQQSKNLMINEDKQIKQNRSMQKISPSIWRDQQRKINQSNQKSITLLIQQLEKHPDKSVKQKFVQQQVKVNDRTQMIQQTKQSEKVQQIKEKGQTNSQIKQKIITKNNDLVFDFPSKLQQQRLKNCNPQNISTILNQLIAQKKSKRIEYSIQMLKTNQKNNKGPQMFFVNFICCKNKNIRKPYLQFVKKPNQKEYSLSSNWRKHKHNLNENELKNVINLQVENKSQYLDLVQEKKYQIISETQNNIDKTNKQLGGQHYDQKHQSQEDVNFPPKTKQIKKFTQKSPKKVQVVPIQINPSNKKEDKKVEQAKENSQKFSERKEQKKLNMNLLGKQLEFSHTLEIVKNIQLNKNQMMIDEKNEKNKEFLFEHRQNRCDQQLETSNKKENILQWLHKYHEIISNLIQQKKWKCQSKSQVDYRYQMKGQFVQRFPQYQKDQDNDFQIWNQCIFEIMEWNQFEPLEFSNDKNSQRQQDEFLFQNIIFVRKTQNVNTAQKALSLNIPVEVYLSVYPIEISSTSYHLKIILAYKLKNNKQPQLLWFYVYKQSQRRINFGSILNEHKKSDQLLEVLRQSVKHFGMRKVKFIYTTFEYQLIKSLDKICQTNSTLNSQYDLSSTINFFCVKELFCNQRIFENSQLGNEINRRIHGYQNFEKIKQSFNVLNNIFDSDNQKREKFINPRIIYQHYKTFTLPFSKNQVRKELSQIDTEFLLKELYISQNETNNKNPFDELNEIFIHLRQFNHMAQVFVLIMDIFNANPTRLSTKQITKKRILPFGTYQIRKENNIFNQICDKSQNFPFTIEKIFKQTVYEMSSIIVKCPRFIIETIYRLIIVANLLAIKNQKQIQFHSQNSKFYLFNDYENSSILHKVSISEQKNNLGQISNKFNQNSFDSQENCKKRFCSCNFYNLAGIPCQHEILTALINKDSLFNEINQCWKISN